MCVSGRSERGQETYIRENRARTSGFVSLWDAVGVASPIACLDERLGHRIVVNADTCVHESLLGETLKPFCAAFRLRPGFRRVRRLKRCPVGIDEAYVDFDNRRDR